MGRAGLTKKERKKKPTNYNIDVCYLNYKATGKEQENFAAKVGRK